jgi:hypothetical protein
MDWKRRMSVEVKDADVKKLQLGDEVTITCKGKVKELNLGDPPKEEDKKKRKEKGCCGCGIAYHEPSRIVIEMDSQEVSSGENVFSVLSRDKDED